MILAYAFRKKFLKNLEENKANTFLFSGSHKQSNAGKLSSPPRHLFHKHFTIVNYEPSKLRCMLPHLRTVCMYPYSVYKNKLAYFDTVVIYECKKFIKLNTEEC